MMTRQPLLRQCEVAQRLIADRRDAAPGRFPPATRAANRERLASDHRRHCLAHVHGIGVHDPRHRLVVRVHIRRGNVLLRPDELNDVGSVAPSHALELALRHLVRIADDSAFRTAERNVDHRALPCHPAGQGANFIQRYLRRKSNAALARPARHRMLHAKAGEYLNMSVVHHYRDMNNDLPVGVPQNLPDAVVQV